MIHNPKLFTLEDAAERRKTLRASKKRLVLTNGCFDLLHVGHLKYLKDAADLGDELWIVLNGDSSVRALKGPSRPVQSNEERAYMLASLESVSGVVIFETPRLTREILTLQPDIYVKAGDYTLETLNQEEREALEQVGAEIRFMPFVDGYSTTSLIDKIQKAGVSA